TSNGHELGPRESMVVAGIAYDPPRDLWYLFEGSSSFSPAPSDAVTLHIRRLDRVTGAWTELSKTSVPTLVWYDGIAPTRDRLTFIANATDGGTKTRMVTYDTSNPAAPTLLDDQELAATPAAMVATRSGSGAGGRLALLNTGSSAAGDCAEAGAGQCTAKIHRYL